MVRSVRRLILVLFALVTAPIAGYAQPAGGVPRIGVVAVGPPPGTPGAPTIPPFETFVRALRELGWIQGQTIQLEWGPADLAPTGMVPLAADFVSRRVDVIVALGPGPIRRGIHKVTGGTPLVFVAGTDDPIRDGLVQSLARPGGPVTGVTWAASQQMEEKLLQILKEAVPRVARVGGFSERPGGPDTDWQALAAAGRMLSLQLMDRVRVTDARTIEQAFTTFASQRADAVYVPMVGATYAERQRIAALALRHRIPTFALLRELPEAAGLLSYGPDLHDIYRRGAGYVDRILRGAKAAELPVEQPTRYELFINLATAQALGLTIPPAVLTRADRLIQ
jgi:putative ABC transport system substrate-binding protein